MEFKRMNYPITEGIHQAISEAWEEWHKVLSPDLTSLPNLSFIQGFKAAVRWINEQPEEPDDLTVAYMAGIEKGKDIIRSQYSGEPAGNEIDDAKLLVNIYMGIHVSQLKKMPESVVTAWEKGRDIRGEINEGSL